MKKILLNLQNTNKILTLASVYVFCLRLFSILLLLPFKFGGLQLMNSGYGLVSLRLIGSAMFGETFNLVTRVGLP